MLTPGSEETLEAGDELLFVAAQAREEQLEDLLSVMAGDEIAPEANVEKLAEELSEHYGNQTFRSARTMGELVIEHLSTLERPHAGL